MPDPKPHPNEESLSTRLVDVSRRFDKSMETVNLPVWRASSVLFDRLADIEPEV